VAFWWFLAVAGVGSTLRGSELGVSGALCSSGLSRCLGFFGDGKVRMFDFQVLMFDFQPQAIEGAHVDIGDPYEGELGDEVATPSLVEHLEAGEEEEERRHVVAEAVLTREQIEEFALEQPSATLAAILAEVARFSKDILMRDGPRDAGDGQAEED
jgi:hypothetical protein